MNRKEQMSAKQIRNAMTVDVEDYFQVSAFASHIPRDNWPTLSCRVEANVDCILAMFDVSNIRATFFTLGWIAERYPAMVRRIVGEGHELASHGYAHDRASDLDAKSFSEDVVRSKHLLEDISGHRVMGYRAPSFSISGANLWTLDALLKARYRYSSSIYPIRHDHYGMPDAPRFAFYPNGDEGLLELPITTVRLLNRNFPAGGGGYFRFFPYAASRWLMRRVNDRDGQRAVRAIAELVESPKGVLYTRNASGQYAATAEWNLAFNSDPESPDGSLCEFLRLKQWVIELQEYDAHPERYVGLSVPAWLRSFPQAWLIVPLSQNEELFGFVVLSRPRSKLKLNWEVLDLLKIVGIQTASYLAKQESANALTVARQFETFNRMSTFVVHDLKNLVSQLRLLIANAEKHQGSPEFQKDMLDTIEHAMQKMQILLQKFNRESKTERHAIVSLDKLLQQTVASKSIFEPKPCLEICKSDLAVSANAGRLERILGHLIQNAIEATSRDGAVTIRLDERNENALIEVVDTGRGMSDQFIRARLFKPFESTKPAGMGIGVFEAREYVQQIGGRLEVESLLEKGTTFRMSLPLYDYDQDKLSSAA